MQFKSQSIKKYQFKSISCLYIPWKVCSAKFHCNAYSDTQVFIRWSIYIECQRLCQVYSSTYKLFYECNLHLAHFCSYSKQKITSETSQTWLAIYSGNKK